MEVVSDVPVTGGDITHPITPFSCLPSSCPQWGGHQNSLELWSGLGKAEYQFAWVERKC